MKIYIIEDDISVISVLEDIIEQNTLGIICGDTDGEPADLSQIQALPESSLDSAFKTTALTILALCRYETSSENISIFREWIYSSASAPS